MSYLIDEGFYEFIAFYLLPIMAVIVIICIIFVVFFKIMNRHNDNGIIWKSTNGGPHFATPKKVECDKTIKLEGTQSERIVQILKAAGWFQGRSVDITAVEDLYKKHGALLTEGAKNFYREFHAIAGNWWVSWNFNPKWGCDVSFDLIPNIESDEDLADMLKNDYFREDFLNFDEIMSEPVSYVGEIGYYYPSNIFIGESGKIYKINSNHIETFETFSSICEFLEQDLGKLKMEYVTTLTNEEWKSMRER